MASGDQFDFIRPKNLSPESGLHDQVALVAVGSGLTGVPLAKLDGQGYQFEGRVPSNGSPLATGLTFQLGMVDDPNTPDPGKVIRLGITVKRLANNTDTLDAAVAAATEQTSNVTMPATAGLVNLVNVPIANANLDTLAAGDRFLVRLRRIGSHSADTHQGRAVLLGITVRDT